MERWRVHLGKVPNPSCFGSGHWIGRNDWWSFILCSHRLSKCGKCGSKLCMGNVRPKDLRAEELAVYIQHLMRKIENEAFVGQRLIFAVSQRISALAKNLLFMDPFVVAFSSMNNSMYMICLLLSYHTIEGCINGRKEKGTVGVIPANLYGRFLLLPLGYKPVFLFVKCHLPSLVEICFFAGDNGYAYYWLRPRKRKILSSGADKYYLRQRKTVKERFSLGTGNEINSDLLNEQSQLILVTNYLNIELVHQIVRLLYDEKTRYKGLEKRSSKKVGSSSVPCKTIQVYRRRIKKNQRSNKCKTVRPFFSEGQSKKRKRSILSTEGLNGSRRKDVSLPIHKKPRLQASRSESGPLVKHCKNSQIHHKKQDALDETASETDKIILRPKVILDEDTIQEWKFLVEKPEHEGCKFERCDDRWEIERALFHGRVISFISRMHLIQGLSDLPYQKRISLVFLNPREQKYDFKNETSAHKSWKALEDKFLKKSG
ncbi:hypothetical protein BC332_30526 [Capsicum chinense]|nr:hypothetical protein BC332_30526 [Capsicum chinense]